MDSNQYRRVDSVIRSRRVVLPGGIKPAAIHVRDGTIIKVGAWDEAESATLLFDAGDHAILPGVVDLHAHINEPGRTAWEGFESATRAAAAGGITTLVDMPLNSIPATVGAAELDRKISATAGKLWIDVGFHGGIVPGNENNLPPLIRAGVVGLKCFLCDSGVDEFPAVTIDQLAGPLQRVSELNPWILVHAECPEVLAAARERLKDRRTWTYRDYLKSRPDEAEIAAIRQLIELAEITNVRIHIVHLSSAAALPLLAQAKAKQIRITSETCPHYLTFEADSIADSATALKCAPPIRSAANRDALWKGLREGVIDIIASDHSPCLPELKADRDFSRAWGGISSLQCSLAAVWSEAHQRGFGLSDVALWMCQRPAELGRLTMKGSIAPGKDADLICFAPDETFTFEADQIIHRHKLTPYSGRQMLGVVQQTFLRGAPIYDGGSWENQPRGRIVRAASLLSAT
jgi:allantoinase